MNAIRKSFLIGLTALGMSTATVAAYADEPASAPASAPQAHQGHQKPTKEQMQQHREQMMQHMQEKMAEHFAMQQARLHVQLKLTPAQEPAWNAYQAAIKPVPHTGPRPDFKAFAAMPAPDRMAKMIDMMKQRTATMESHLAAVKTFYATLNADQKKVYDKQAMGGHHHRGGHHHHRGHHHGGWQQHGGEQQHEGGHGGWGQHDGNDQHGGDQHGGWNHQQ